MDSSCPKNHYQDIGRYKKTKQFASFFAQSNKSYFEKLWGGKWDSNPRQPESQSGTLPTELFPPSNFGPPDRIRTCDPRLRRPMLYPTELRAVRLDRRRIGRGEGIRTPDILLPKQARYQTTLHPALSARGNYAILFWKRQIFYEKSFQLEFFSSAIVLWYLSLNGPFMIWHCGTLKLDMSRPWVMGIVNATPDSFSDGGAYRAKEAAIAHALRLVEEGADILDIGGESTRPGAAEVSVNEEIDRVVPVIEALAGCGKAISVDTSKPEVMREAIKAGAHIVNDVRALHMPGALEVVSASDVGVCLMHMQGAPKTMQDAPCYNSVVDEVEDYLLTRAKECESLGIARSRICLDYGFGFGKTVEQNFALLAQTDRFVRSGYPILVGLSRKSSLGVVTGRAVGDRVVASVTGALLAVQAGAQIIRVHDVAETVDALKIWLMTKTQRI